MTAARGSRRRGVRAVLICAVCVCGPACAGRAAAAGGRRWRRALCHMARFGSESHPGLCHIRAFRSGVDAT